MRTAPYDPLNRVAITTHVGESLSITFSNDDRIEHLVLGQDDAPIGIPKQEKGANAPPAVHVLPIQAFAPGTTNLIVVTLQPDNYTERTYQFLVHVKPSLKDPDTDPDETCSLTFTYKAQEQQVAHQNAVVTWKERQAAALQKKAEARLSTDIFYGDHNWKYIAIGDNTIAPYEASDNGWLSGFRFPGNVSLPTAYIVDGGAWCDMKKPPPTDWLRAPERTARTESKDDMLIVQQTAPHFRFRLGAHVVDVSNCGFDAVGHNPGTGTTSPDVLRVVNTQ